MIEPCDLNSWKDLDEWVYLKINDMTNWLEVNA